MNEFTKVYRQHNRLDKIVAEINRAFINKQNSLFKRLSRWEADQLVNMGYGVRYYWWPMTSEIYW